VRLQRALRLLQVRAAQVVRRVQVKLVQPERRRARVPAVMRRVRERAVRPPCLPG
jgi:hypothetical protein